MLNEALPRSEWLETEVKWSAVTVLMSTKTNFAVSRRPCASNWLCTWRKTSEEVIIDAAQRNTENKTCEAADAANRCWWPGKTVSTSKIPGKEMSYIQMKHKHSRVASEVQQWGSKTVTALWETMPGKFSIYIHHLFIQGVTESQLKFSQEPAKSNAAEASSQWLKRETL